VSVAGNNKSLCSEKHFYFLKIDMLYFSVNTYAGEKRKKTKKKGRRIMKKREN